MVKENRRAIGKQAQSFGFSCQTIITIKDRNSKRKQVIAQAKRPDDEGQED
jgi:hypothetical protein